MPECTVLTEEMHVFFNPTGSCTIMWDTPHSDAEIHKRIKLNAYLSVIKVLEDDNQCPHSTLLKKLYKQGSSVW